MKTIKWESDGLRSFTPCPYGAKNIVSDVYVGSVTCRQCKHFVSVDDENKSIKCKKP